MRFLVFTLVLFYSSVSFSQVNMESDRGGDKKGWGTTSALGLTLQGGNVELFSYLLELRLDYVDDHNHYYLVGSNQYGEQKGKAFKNQGFSHIRWTHMFNFIGTEIFSQIEYDEFKDLKMRQLNGLGVRLEFMKVFAFGLSGMSDYEQLKGVKEGNFDWRGSSYMSLSSKWEKLDLHLVGYYQPLFRDFLDYRMIFVGSISYAVTKSFSIKNLLTHAYDTVPASGVLNKDTQLILSLNFKWWDK